MEEMAEARVGLHRNVPPNTCTLHLGLHMQAHVRTTHKYPKLFDL